MAEGPRYHHLIDDAWLRDRRGLAAADRAALVAGPWPSPPPAPAGVETVPTRDLLAELRRRLVLDNDLVTLRELDTMTEALVDCAALDRLDQRATATAGQADDPFDGLPR